MAKKLPALYTEGYMDAQQRIVTNIEWDINHKERAKDVKHSTAAMRVKLDYEIGALKYILTAIQHHQPTDGERKEAREEDERRAQRALRKITGQEA